MTADTANDEQAAYWNGDEAEHWLANEHRYERMLVAFNAHLLEAAGIDRFDRVLDIGCGCGSTTRAAGGVAAEGRALGIDLSKEMLRRAELTTRKKGLANVVYEHADVQVHAFVDSTYDAAISRFGVMFFSDPITAFANVRRALRPGASMAFVCWAELLQNEWMVVPGAAAASYVALPSPDDPAAPGPFSLADRERLLAVLEASGLVDVSIDAVSETLLLGSDPVDSFDFLKKTGIGQTLLREAGSEQIARVTDAVTAALEPFVTPDGVRLGSKAWLVTARRPRRR